MQSSVVQNQAIYQELAEAFAGSLTWEWDDRFGGVVAAFHIDEKDRMQAIVSAQFEQEWDKRSIRRASPSLKATTKNFGGLKSRQLLFTADLAEGVMLLGMWWPWGHGATISLRIVPCILEGSPSDGEAVQAELKEAFGL